MNITLVKTSPKLHNKILHDFINFPNWENIETNDFGTWKKFHQMARTFSYAYEKKMNYKIICIICGDMRITSTS